MRLRRPSASPARSAGAGCAPLCVLLATLLVAVAAFTHDHRAWFRLWLPLGEVTPSRDTYLRLVRRLDPETAMQAALLLLDGTSLPDLEELVLALDGKGARRSGDRAAGLLPLHMVSAFLVREGLTLSQEPCEAKSNEIAALPRLLDRIHLAGAVVTIDAAGCQTAIVQALRKAGADYVLAVKRNQQTLHREVKAAFDDAARGAFTPQAAHLHGPGRPRPAQPDPGAGGAHRAPRVPAALGALLHPGRSVEAAALLELIRGHWGIENSLHRTLDMQFREDDCCMRTGNAPAVMGILRRTVLNMIRTMQRKLETDVSIGLLRDRIGRQPWILAAALP